MISVFFRFLLFFTLFFAFSGQIFSGLFAQIGPYKLLQSGIEIQKFSDDGKYAVDGLHVLKKNAKGKYQVIFNFYKNPTNTNFVNISAISGDASYAVSSDWHTLRAYSPVKDDFFITLSDINPKEVDTRYEPNVYHENSGLTLSSDGKILMAMSLGSTNMPNSVIFMIPSGYALFGHRDLNTPKDTSNNGYLYVPRHTYGFLYYTLLGDRFIRNFTVTPDFSFVATGHMVKIPKKNTVIKEEFITLWKNILPLDDKKYELSLETYPIASKVPKPYKKYYTFKVPLADHFAISSNANVVVLPDATIWQKQNTTNEDTPPDYEKIQSLGEVGKIKALAISLDGKTIVMITGKDADADKKLQATIWQRDKDDPYKKKQSIAVDSNSLTMTPDAKHIAISSKIYIKR